MKTKNFRGKQPATPETFKQIIQLIHCNVRPRYQQSRVALRYQILPLIIQEDLCKVLEVPVGVKSFRVVGPKHPLTEIFEK